jgi:predicted dehydrogenase
MAKTTGLGIVGCGNISDAYLNGAARSRLVEVVAVTDLRPEVAAAQAKAHGVRAATLDELLADPGIAIVINLTVPLAHAEVSRAILEAGKHVYSEKPLAVDVAQAKAILDAAGSRGLRVGCAPDTFLGAAHQAVRRAVDQGRIGTVTGGAACFATPGMEMWHPAPFFFYQKGGGPVLDIGCYPITQLINLMGRIESVVAHASKGRATRTVTSQPHAGTVIEVEVPTTVNGALAFASGANVAFTASWDIWKHGRTPIEIYGTEGSILNPDPNFFGGTVKISDKGGDWQDLPIADLPFGAPNRTLRSGAMVADYRIAGVLDMAAAIAQGRAHRCDGAMALHALEAMEALERSSREGRRIVLETRCERPAPVPPGTGEEVFTA